ncbi:unnamed protein product [Porites evermanni]|uniref:DOMON domain-containing protein n=1 Tax=Porites evermanni TaxID=104178 RepID=A0ABN8MI50_9CNID|nr:unnamed protein product [Porites evermanni]
MEMARQISAAFLFTLLANIVVRVDSSNHASFESGDGNFRLQWTYNNNTLFFNMTCKTTGWCAVGFTTSADGKRMKNYDIAVGGVTSNYSQYIFGYHSVSTSTPNKDPTPDYKLTAASEENGYTRVEFNRIATTDEEDDPHDVQFRKSTEVWIVWAWRVDDDASSDLTPALVHSQNGVSSKKYNLIMEATSNGPRSTPYSLTFAGTLFVLIMFVTSF